MWLKCKQINKKKIKKNLNEDIFKSVLGGVLLDTVTTAECKQKWVLNSGLHDSQTTLYLLRHCVVTAVVVF